MIDSALVATVALFTAGVSAVGVVYTIRRDGKASREREAELDKERIKFTDSLRGEIKHIKEQLSDPNNGLAAIKSEIGDMKETCSGARAGFKARIDNLEKE